MIDPYNLPAHPASLNSQPGVAASLRAALHQQYLQYLIRRICIDASPHK